jgi:hypothetical protein
MFATTVSRWYAPETTPFWTSTTSRAVLGRPVKVVIRHSPSGRRLFITLGGRTDFQRATTGDGPGVLCHPLRVRALPAVLAVPVIIAAALVDPIAASGGGGVDNGPTPT